MKKLLITVLLLTLYGCGGSSETDNPPISTGPSSYSVSTSADTGGSITPSSQNVISGNTTTFTIIAESGYSILDATGCGGSLSGANYTTGTISADCEVATSFTLEDIISSYTLTGNFEKGPFIIGSEITIQEFDDNLVSTGKTFHTETISNTGNYNMDLSLTEELVEVSADGYYFNEISGELSNSKLRLSALASVSDNENININILTHLSKKRIKTLISDGKVFSVAKKQAEEEVQELFSFVSADWEINDFDRMSISEHGDDNSYLLLTSAIIQNIYLSTSQLSQYIELLAQDLSDNGVVNDESLVESINLSAQEIDLSVVETNLTTYYEELGETVNLPDFELLLNRQPISNAGADSTALVGVEFTLDGSHSNDIDDDSLTYQWTLRESPEGSTASLGNENSVSPSLTPDMLGSYSVGLIVNDGELSSDVDIVVISPENQFPVADTGDDLSIMGNVSIILDGSNSFDPEGSELTYLWTIDNSDLTHSEAIWNVGIPSIPEDYIITFTLLVTDAEGLSSESDLVVTFLPDFSDNKDGTVSDGLGNTWQQGSSDSMKYIAQYYDGASDESYAKYYCSNLNLNGFQDWVVPNLSTLRLLIDIEQGSPTIDTSFFPNTLPESYASSLNVIRSGSAIDFNDGSNYSTSRAYVRCVR